MGAGLGLAFAAAVGHAQYLQLDAVARYGRNVDSGAHLLQLAFFVLLPAHAIFLLAGVGLHRRWRFARWLHWLGIGWLTIPVFYVLIAEGRRLIAA